MDIKKIVNSLVKKHKTRNPFEIIKGLNVILVPVPLEGVRGFYQYFQRTLDMLFYFQSNLMLCHSDYSYSYFLYIVKLYTPATLPELLPHCNISATAYQ